MGKLLKIDEWTDEHANKMLEAWGDPRDFDSWWPWKKELLTRILSYLVGNSVLDVGCGIGHFYSLLKDVEYLGLDFLDLIEKCKGFFPKGNFKVGNIYELDDIGMWDTVVAVQVLVHLPDFESLVKSLWEHTNERLIFTIFPPRKKEKIWYKSGIYGIKKHIRGHIISFKQFEKIVGNLKKLWDYNYEIFNYDNKTVWIVVMDR